jgi:hypothetical protein
MPGHTVQVMPGHTVRVMPGHTVRVMRCAPLAGAQFAWFNKCVFRCEE